MKNPSVLRPVRDQAGRVVGYVTDDEPRTIRHARVIDHVLGDVGAIRDLDRPILPGKIVA